MDALQPIASQLGLDQTFYPLFLMVAVLYFVLSAVYLKPFQRLLLQRKEKTEGTKKQAQELMANATACFEEYRSRLKEVQEKAQKALDEAEESAKKEETAILAEASLKARSSIQTAQKQLTAEYESVLKSLSSDIPEIAAEIATKVLGRQIGTR